MRSLLLSFCFALCTCALAQDKGFVSGTVSFEQETTSSGGSDDELARTTIVFGPAVGVNIGESNVVGLAINIARETEEMAFYSVFGDPTMAERQSMMIELAPFYRRVKSVGDKCSIYGQALVGIGFGNETIAFDGPGDDPETDMSSVRVALGPGIFYHFADHWAVSADWGALRYASVSENSGDDEDDEVTTTTFGLGLNPGAITFALNWTF